MTGDPLQHVQPGQPFAPSAGAWNAFVDTARTVREGRVLFGSPAPEPETETLWFDIKNISGEEIPPHGCVELVNLTGPLHASPDVTEVGTDRGTYWAAVKPFSFYASRRECKHRKFAFNAAGAIAAGKHGRVRRAGPKPTKCLLDPRLLSFERWTFESDLAPVPGTWYLGCGAGFRFAGNDEDFPSIGEFVWGEDTYPTGYVVEHELFDPACTFAVPQCLNVTIPALNCGSSPNINAPGGTFKLACCSATANTNACRACVTWKDLSVANNEVTLTVTDPAPGDKDCRCKATLHYKYNAGGDQLDAYWEAETGWQELFDGQSAVAETWDFIGRQAFASGTSFGSAVDVCSFVAPADITITRDYDCTPSVDAPNACGGSYTPPACAGGTMTIMAAQYQRNSGVCYIVWAPPLISAGGGHCKPLDPCVVCGPPTAAGDTCDVAICDDGYDCPTWTSFCKTDCPQPPPKACFCGPGCLWEFGTYDGAGDAFAIAYFKVSDCLPKDSVGDPPTGLAKCESQCTCPEAVDVWGPADVLYSDGGPAFVTTECFCPNGDCPQFGKCGWQWNRPNPGWNPCAGAATCNCAPDEGCLTEPGFSGTEDGEIAYTDCEVV